METTQSGRRESSLERLLGIIDLFASDQPVWTLDQISARSGRSRATTYRYLKELSDSGLVSTVGRRGFVLGPRIMELDRQIRICDPLILAARGVMDRTAAELGSGVLLLTGRYGDSFVCVHSAPEPADLAVTYSRGRVLPRFWGSTSLTILAHMATRTLARIFATEADAIAEAGHGADWQAFSRKMADIRRAGIHVSKGAIDPGTLCQAVPVFSSSRNVVGALCLVQREGAEGGATGRELVIAAGRAISARLCGMFAGHATYAPVANRGDR